MRKLEIIKEISKGIGIERLRVEAIVEAFTNSIKEHISNKRTVSLRGFGNFTAKKQAAKIARNISKNIEIHLPERYVPAFKPSKKFKDKLIKKVK